MKELEIYVVQYCQSDAVWVFASKNEAVDHIEDQLEKYMAEGIKAVWTWNCRDACTVKLDDTGENSSCDTGGFYRIWKDTIELSEEDIYKLTIKTIS